MEHSHHCQYVRTAVDLMYIVYMCHCQYVRTVQPCRPGVYLCHCQYVRRAIDLVYTCVSRSVNMHANDSTAGRVCACVHTLPFIMTGVVVCADKYILVALENTIVLTVCSQKKWCKLLLPVVEPVCCQTRV